MLSMSFGVASDPRAAMSLTTFFQSSGVLLF